MAKRKNSSEEKPTDPTIKELELFCKIVDELRRTPKKSMNAIARDVHASPAKVSRCVSNVNDWYKRTLVYTDVGRRGGRLAEDVDQVTGGIGEFFKSCERLRGQAWPSITVGTTNAILTGLLPNPVHNFISKHARDRPALEVRFVEADWDTLGRQIHGRQLDFAFGPWIPDMPYKDVHMERVGPQIEAVAVFHPDHRWGKREKSLTARDLASEYLLVLPAKEQPAVFNVVPSGESQRGRRIVMNNYTSIMAAVRMGIGVSVVPHWPEALEMYEVGCLRISRGPTFQLAVYLREDGRDKLDPVEQEFIQLVERYLTSKTS